ncbi:redoxin [Methylomonas koyamae]|nr:redoxin [Methylomonas koyamae]
MKSALIPFLICLFAVSGSAVAADEAVLAPDCRFAGFESAPERSLSQYRGKVVYLDFWASWCGPCLESFPFMNRLHSQLQDKGLVVLAVNLDENLEDGAQFLAQHRVDFAVAVDSGQACAKQLQLKAMPSSYLIDRNGRIRARHLGFRVGEAEQFGKQVEQLLDEPTAP